MGKPANAAQQPSLPKYLVLEKKRGETPLELLQDLKKRWIQEGKLSEAVAAALPLSYAGRLDPMAEGKLLVLVGDECKRQSRYTKLDKEYKVTVLLGAKTDTGDLLGLVSDETFSNSSKYTYKDIDKRYISQKLPKILSEELGSHSRKYPVFSSKTVNGKPLFLYALENKLQEIQVPEHIETIYKISLHKRNGSSAREEIENIEVKELQARIMDALAVVPRSEEESKKLGEDFRQDAIRARWKEFFLYIEQRNIVITSQDEAAPQLFYMLHLRVTCGSGAYMRTLAERIGASLGVPALAFSIKRTKMGQFLRIGPLGVWLKTY